MDGPKPEDTIQPEYTKSQPGLPEKPEPMQHGEFYITEQDRSSLARHRRPSRTPLFVLVIACLLLAAGIVPRLRQSATLAQSSSAARNHVTEVNIARPIAGNGTSEVQLPSNVQSIEDTPVNARTTGYLKILSVDIGSRVTKGQTLAIIEAPDLDQQLVQAQADASRSRATTEQAKADVVRYQANVTQAKSEVVRFESNMAASQAELAHSEARLLAAQGAVSEAEARVQQSNKKLAGLRADLQRAKTRQELASKTYARWKELARGGAVSGQDLDESAANYDSSIAQVNSSQADVESGEADLLAASATLRARNGDVDAAKADIASAKQVINAAAAAVDSAKSNVHAVAANVVAARANVAATNAGIASSDATVNKYQTMRSFERVTAPFDGVITARNVDVGALINAGGAGLTGSALDPTTTVPHSGMFGIARTDELRIQVPVPQTYSTSLKLGQEARVRIREFPGHTFIANVFWISGALDAASRTRMVELRLKNPNNLLVPGMYANVSMDVHNAHALWKVPANTLIIDAVGVRVATVTPDNTIRFVQVKLGRDFGKEVEVTEGLSGDEVLVTDPTDDLIEGEHVKAADAHTDN